MAVVFSSMKDMGDLYYHILQLVEIGKSISFNEDRIPFRIQRDTLIRIESMVV